MSDHEQTLRELGAKFTAHAASSTPTMRVKHAATAAACLSGADALVRATQTCESCAHSNDADAVQMGTTYCTLRDGFYSGLLMEFGSRCSAWATRED